MPTKCGKKDSKGYYCQWGSKGAHYYYKKGDKVSMARARKKADAQGAAAHASGYQGSLDTILASLENITNSLNVLMSKIEGKNNG